MQKPGRYFELWMQVRKQGSKDNLFQMLGCRSEDTTTAVVLIIKSLIIMENNSNVLWLPKDFCGACKMFQIDPLDAIHFYINQTTVYSSLVKSQDKTISIVSKIFAQCLKKKCSDVERMDEHKRIAGIKYVKEVVKIIEGKYSQVERMRLYKNTISRWYEVIEAKLPPKIIKISIGGNLSLTNDYCILSDVFQFTPVTLVQHYVNHVSLSQYINPTKDNPFEYATTFFLQYPPVIERISKS